MFSPWSSTFRTGPCWHCRSYGGMLDLSAALCDRDGFPRVRSMAREGCSGYEREPGADDDVPTLGRVVTPEQGV